MSKKWTPAPAQKGQHPPAKPGPVRQHHAIATMGLKKKK